MPGTRAQERAAPWRAAADPPAACGRSCGVRSSGRPAALSARRQRRGQGGPRRAGGGAGTSVPRTCPEEAAAERGRRTRKGTRGLRVLGGEAHCGHPASLAGAPQPPAPLQCACGPVAGSSAGEPRGCPSSCATDGRTATSNHPLPAFAFTFSFSWGLRGAPGRASIGGSERRAPAGVAGQSDPSARARRRIPGGREAASARASRPRPRLQEDFRFSRPTSPTTPDAHSETAPRLASPGGGAWGGSCGRGQARPWS